MRPNLNYICGCDIGGTFTDIVLADDSGRLICAKTRTTPHDLSEGLFAGLELVARKEGISLDTLLRQTRLMGYGTTIGMNAVIERRPAVKVGLITTKGHGDVLSHMRGGGRTDGVSIYDLLHLSIGHKPDPIVPRYLIEEVSERIDCKGQIVVQLNEEEVVRSIRHLVEKGVEAIAICFLWSFLNPEHELKVKKLVEELAPHVFVTASCELAPRIGEYERTAATCINCFTGPVVSKHIDDFQSKLEQLGYEGPVLIMQNTGGTGPAKQVSAFPVATLQSGPAGGVSASAYLGRQIGYNHIITTDIGGTSFDVGLIYEGVPLVTDTTCVSNYEFFLPTLDIKSIGAGGGSIASIDKVTGSMRVGPRSAGAHPGPACYDRGGVEPTVTDADVVLGYINPDYFLGGAIKLNKKAAEESLKKLGNTLGMSVIEAAAGVARILEAQAADLVREVTIGRGYDPRDFVVFAYGGAGPTHATQYAKELGIEKVIIPMGDVASLWSALGVASADMIYVCGRTEVLVAPFEAQKLEEVFQGLENRAREALVELTGLRMADIEVRRFADMRYGGQVNELEIPVPEGPLTQEQAGQLVETFERKYAFLYGEEAGYKEAGIGIAALKCRGVRGVATPSLLKSEVLSEEVPSDAAKGEREVYWYEEAKAVPTAIYHGPRLQPGNSLTGPVIIEMPDTTIVVPPKRKISVDAFGNFIIEPQV